MSTRLCSPSACWRIPLGSFCHRVGNPRQLGRHRCQRNFIRRRVCRRQNSRFRHDLERAAHLHSRPGRRTAGLSRQFPFIAGNAVAGNPWRRGYRHGGAQFENRRSRRGHAQPGTHLQHHSQRRRRWHRHRSRLAFDAASVDRRQHRHRIYCDCHSHDPMGGPCSPPHLDPPANHLSGTLGNGRRSITAPSFRPHFQKL